MRSHLGRSDNSCQQDQSQTHDKTARSRKLHGTMIQRVSGTVPRTAFETCPESDASGVSPHPQPGDTSYLA